MARTLTLFMVLVVAIAFLASPAEAQRFNAQLSIGDACPAWENLPGTDGKNHSLKDLEKATAVVVVFTCNQCPVAVAYEDRFMAFAKEYAEKGVKFVAINVNTSDSEKLPAMKERAAEKGFSFPYLYDESQAIARNYGAQVTPHLYLLDGQRKLAYVGAFDDNQDKSRVKENYLKDAVEAVLAGKPVENAETRPKGCGIGYKSQ
ncbi:MAG: thioredoxin family protein [Pirellulales bacterium]|nr:thioredoxin family protein [Pirellulales bacterium]